MLIEHVQDRLRRPDAMQTQDLVALLSAGSKNSAEDRLLQLERAIMSGSAIKPDLPDVTRPRQELLEQVELKMAIGDELRMQTEPNPYERSEEHTSELQSLMRISYAVFCLKKKKQRPKPHRHN